MSADLLALCALSALALHALGSWLLRLDGGALAGEVAALIDWCASLARTYGHRREDRYNG